LPFTIRWQKRLLATPYFKKTSSYIGSGKGNLGKIFKIAKYFFTAVSSHNKIEFPTLHSSALSLIYYQSNHKYKYCCIKKR
jgi:hypothetical protein